MQIDRDSIVVTGKFLKLARLKDEWYEDVEKPTKVIETLVKSNIKADIFTFWQRLPETNPQYHYYMEWDSIAALPVSTYAHWWESQIDSKIRNIVRKAEKKGVIVKPAEFTNDFIRGMMEIFNESPVRQGKPFWHFGKDFETIKREFSRYLFRESLIGAYYNNELIGFIMLANAGKYAITAQIISKIGHRDKAPTNALLAKAVDICVQKKINYLVYAKWDEGSLGDFKRSNGFIKIDLPRYYVPLNMKGKLMLMLHLHNGINGILPEKLKTRILTLRKKWYLIKRKHSR